MEPGEERERNVKRNRKRTKNKVGRDFSNSTSVKFQTSNKTNAKEAAGDPWQSRVRGMLGLESESSAGGQGRDGKRGYLKKTKQQM